LAVRLLDGAQMDFPRWKIWYRLKGLAKSQLSTLVVLDADQDLTNVDAVTESSGSAEDLPARVLLILASFFA